MFFPLAFLPGAWIAFGLRMPGFSFWGRCCTGIALGPLVIVVQFYALRLAGVPFESLPVLLVALNLPAAYLVYRRFDRASLPRLGTLALAALVLFVALAPFGPQVLNPQARLYTGHAWMHTDIVYMIANGEMLVDDPELAGVRLAYPWAGHVYQAVLSQALDVSPASSFIWTNLLCVPPIYWFLAAIVGALGGSRLARITSVLWLFLGVSFLGYVLRLALPARMIGAAEIWGDYRYTPWIWKFLFFSQMPLALVMFAALVYLAVDRWPREGISGRVVLFTLLTLSIGLVYPLVLPAAVGVAGARMLAGILAQDGRRNIPWQEIVQLSAGVIVAVALSFIHLRFLTEDRVTQAVFLSSLRGMLRKAVESGIVTAPALLGLLVVGQTLWKRMPGPTVVLVAGAAASYVLYVVLDIAFWRGEYKFIFTAGICISPFAALAFQRIVEAAGRFRLLLVAATTAILVAPFAHKVSKSEYWGPSTRPAIDASGFDIRLAGTSIQSQLFEVVRRATPRDSLLVVDRTELHYPTLTRRRMYAPPGHDGTHPGVNLPSEHLLQNVKGYGDRDLVRRRAVLAGLFESRDPARMAQSLDEILALRRPVVLITHDRSQRALVERLMSDRRGALLYEHGEVAAWLIAPRNT